MMTTVQANGVTLGVEHFGDATAPLALLAGGTTMLSWPDALCEALARGGRHLVRYDLRDSGASSIVDPEAPTYTLRDLAADAATLIWSAACQPRRGLSPRCLRGSSRRARAAASAARSRSVYFGALGLTVVDAPLSRRSYRTT